MKIARALSISFLFALSFLAVPGHSLQGDSSEVREPRTYNLETTNSNDVPPPPPDSDAGYAELYRFYVSGLGDIADDSTSFSALPESRDLQFSKSLLADKNHFGEKEAKAELEKLLPQMRQEWDEMIARERLQYAKTKAQLEGKPCNLEINGIQNCPGQEPTLDDNPSIISLIGYHNGLIRSKSLAADRAARSGVYTGPLHWEPVGNVLSMVRSSPGYVVYSTF